MTRFGRGSLALLPRIVEELDPSAVACVADAAVAALHPLPLDVPTLPVPPGESSKTLDGWRSLIDSFAGLKLDRDALVVAFGGGVVCDLAGFCAAAWLRGVSWVAVPTTLLAQVDAAHGGKTGVDHPAAKNLVGAFHPPAETLVDPALLATLPGREVRGGLAEVVKHGVIAAPALLARVGRDDPADFVEEAARVKLDIVGRDPRERGERRLLNLGHTLGHAVEHASGYSLHHGEAVAVGLRGACRIAEAHCGFGDRAGVEEALDRCGLPATVKVAAGALREALAHDKKRSGGRTRWVLPRALGEVAVFDDVPEALVSAALTGI
ncbi:MAG: 3-dehydroquinate synthase family protein [Planctomycetota bacterium]